MSRTRRSYPVAGKDQRQRERAHLREMRDKDRARMKRSVELGGEVGRRSCGRKGYCPSRAAALTRALRSELAHGGELWVYECPLCGGWHLTSHPQAGCIPARSAVQRPRTCHGTSIS